MCTNLFRYIPEWDVLSSAKGAVLVGDKKVCLRKEIPKKIKIAIKERKNLYSKSLEYNNAQLEKERETRKKLEKEIPKIFNSS